MRFDLINSTYISVTAQVLGHMFVILALDEQDPSNAPRCGLRVAISNSSSRKTAGMMSSPSWASRTSASSSNISAAAF